MSIPITEKEADEKYMCDECRNGGDCSFSCVLSETCSVTCQDCLQRIYFEGDYHNQSPDFNCPYCGKNQHSRTIERSIKIRAKIK